MTVTTATPRTQVSPSSVYAPLAVSPSSADTGASSRARDRAALLTVEAERIEQMKGALWEAFRASHPAAIPMPLVDLATAYASLLRLQLSLTEQAPPRRLQPVSGAAQRVARQPP